MAATSTQNHDWKDEQTIKQEEFESGYWDESATQSENPTERDGATEDAVENIQHTHAQTAASETTLYADDRTADHYDPNERLLDGRRRREKYTDLWRYNAGHDNWRADGRSREECHKSNNSTTYKQRLTESVCNRAGLGQTATERATDLAANDCPREFNFIGGICLWILACVVVATEEHGEIGRLDHLYPGELGDDWTVTVGDLDDAVEVVEDLRDV